MNEAASSSGGGIAVTLDELQEARWMLEWADWDRIEIGVPAESESGEPSRLSTASGTASHVATVRQTSIRVLRRAEAVSRGRETVDDLYDWIVAPARDDQRVRLEGAFLSHTGGEPLRPHEALYDLDFLTSEWAPLSEIMPRPAVNPVALGNPGTGIIHSR